MDRLIHTSLSAMRGAMSRQATIANNLANANTVGFRAEIASQRPLWLRGGEFQSRVSGSEEVVNADMKAGAVVQTGRDLDVAMQGDAMLAVQADDGEESYTRRGDLMISPSGLLTTGDGVPVLGDQGPLTLPPADKILISGDGRISIVPEGGDANQLQDVGQLKLASPKGSEIVKGLDGLFRVRGGGVLPSDPDARVTSGALEQSNVNTSDALVQMIEASRAWETQIKLLTTARELDSSSADLMRLPE
ncbi:MAG: flagellar basal body rod protein FlgF [Sphingomonadaceae bacterium]